MHARTHGALTSPMQARVTREHQARISKEIKMTEHVRTYGNVSQKGQKGITNVPTPLSVLRGILCVALR